MAHSDPAVSETISAPDNTRLIINPLSFRMSLGDRFASVLAVAGGQGIDALETPTEADLSAAINSVIANPPDRLIVCGGDGTVQALVTALAGLPDSKRPELLILGGGRTNYTARDLDSQSEPEALLARAGDPNQTWGQTVRHSLIVRQAGQADRHGFFIAGARVNDIIRDCHRYREDGTGWLRRGHLSSAWRVSQLGLLHGLGRLDLPAREIEIDAQGLGTLSGAIRLLLISTLAHRHDWVNPYAEIGQGTLRITATRRNAKGFWVRLPRLVRGRYHPRMDSEQGYLSGRSDRIRLGGVDQICLDGQEHDYASDQPLDVLTGPAFRFIHP